MLQTYPRGGRKKLLYSFFKKESLKDKFFFENYLFEG